MLENTIDQENNKEKDQASHSSIFHTVILVIKGIVIGLLQITPTIPRVRELTIRYYLVITIIYFVLYVCEKRLKINHDHIHHFVSHFGHLFGSLAADILVSLIFPILAIVIAVLCLSWFFYSMYRSFPYHEVPPMLTEANKSGTTNQSDQLPPGPIV